MNAVDMSKMGANISGGVSDLFNMGMSLVNRSDYLKQQKYSNYLAEHGIEVRMRDMQNAGLHPTLATGMPATAPVGSAGNPNVPNKSADSILQSALLKSSISQQNASATLANAQADESRARAANVDVDTDLKKQSTVTEGYKREQMAYAMEIEEYRVKIERLNAITNSRNADTNYKNANTARAVQQATTALSNSNIKVNDAVTALRWTEGALKFLEGQIGWTELDYMLRNDEHMGTTSPELKAWGDLLSEITKEASRNPQLAKMLGAGTVGALQVAVKALAKKANTRAAMKQKTHATNEEIRRQQAGKTKNVTRDTYKQGGHTITEEYHRP